MKQKSEAHTLLIHFILLVENQFGTKVKVVRSDNGPEFKIPQFYSSKGIVHQTSCVNTPQQNGVAERKHRHLLNVARVLLFQANLSKPFWGDAILTAAYLINRTPTPVLQGKTPFEKLFHKEPSYSHLKVFGCQCFVSTHLTRPSKFDPRSIECIFLGYPHGKKGYKVYNLTTKKTLVSRDVIFFEDVFPFPHTNSHLSSNTDLFPSLTTSPYFDTQSASTPHTTPTISHQNPTSSAAPQSADIDSHSNTSSYHISPPIMPSDTTTDSTIVPTNHPTLATPPDLVPSPLQPPQPRRSSRVTKTPTAL